MNNNDQKLSKMRDTYRVVMDSIFDKGSQCALLDYPDHSNVGDSAIWLGEIEYFKQRGVSVPYFSTLNRFCKKKLRTKMPSGIIAIHGGGNFGDIWTTPFNNQKFFQNILSEFPDYKIVQLPQTIFWENEERRDLDFKGINKHPNFTMLVRDQKSYELFKKFSSHPVFLCPDSAFLLELNRVGKRSNEIIGLFRTDKEKVKSKIKVDIPTEDWLVDQRDISFVLGDLIVRIINKLDLQSGQTELFFRNFLASHRVKRGCRQISRGRALVTDRLHAHILACLMGLEHIVLDNSYGKISSFRDTWTHDFEGHIFASELSLVPGLLKKMS